MPNKEISILGDFFIALGMPIGIKVGPHFLELAQHLGLYTSKKKSNKIFGIPMKGKISRHQSGARN